MRNGENEVVDDDLHPFASNIASSALLVLGQIAVTLLGYVLNLLQTFNIDGCSPERHCDFTLVTFAGTLPLIAGAAIAIASLVLATIAVGWRRRAWIFPLIGLGVVIALVPICFVLTGYGTRIYP